uniref:Uncharacterized protein n=1 Tax=Anopheles arabiensis TaxID=7173 RepID=A0A182IG74_ANOAR
MQEYPERILLSSSKCNLSSQLQSDYNSTNPYAALSG